MQLNVVDVTNAVTTKQNQPPDKLLNCFSYASWQGLLHTSAEDASISTVLKHLAYERCFMALRSTN